MVWLKWATRLNLPLKISYKMIISYNDWNWMNPLWKYTCLHNILSISPSNQILRINNLFNARTWVVMLNESYENLGNVRSLHCHFHSLVIIYVIFREIKDINLPFVIGLYHININTNVRTSNIFACCLSYLINILFIYAKFWNRLK